MKKIYNEEENYSELLKDLKNLPKINAPENFELNLMTRIQNKNFGYLEGNKPQFSWLKFLTPSAVVVTAVILFFIFLPNSSEINIPVTNQQTDSKNSIENKKQNIDNSKNEINSTHDIVKPSTPLSIQENTASNARSRFPINNPRAIKVDDYLSGSNTNQKEISRGNVVRSAEEPAEINRFFIAENPDQLKLEKERVRLDSIKKAQAKADSLKKIKK